MRRRERVRAYALAPFVPSGETFEERWTAWERWESSFARLLDERPDLEERLDEVFDVSLPAMPDKPFDPDEI